MLRSFIDTTSVEDSRWGTPLAGEDLDAVCQAIYKGVWQAEWENLYHKYVEIAWAVNIRHARASHKAKTLWKGKRRKGEGRRLLRLGQREADREP